VKVVELVWFVFVVCGGGVGFGCRFVPDGSAVTFEEIEAAMDVVRAFKGEFLVLSGSLPRNAPDYTYARMATVAAGNGVKVVLDTSGNALLTTLKQSKLFLVKPSLSELETIAGKKLDERGIAETARHVVDQGWAEYVTVTLGRSGALLVGRDVNLRLPAIHVPVRSAVGAGDSFLAALVWKLEEGAPIEEAFRFGLAAGAAAAITSGTELCLREDVFAIYEGRLGQPELEPETLE
jgi:6-phosphofructokinase 2